VAKRYAIRFICICIAHIRKVTVLRTSLYERHEPLGAQIVDFAGWEMPIRYAGIIAEHRATRTHAGLFDVSHMGEIHITGPQAGFFINAIVTNDISKAKPGRAVYSPMCTEDGGTVDDLLVYVLGEEKYLLVVNAANTDKDFAWIRGHAPQGVSVTNVSRRYAQIAIQGPNALAILSKLTKTDLASVKYYHFIQDVADIPGGPGLVSRTGYTGEDGFEMYMPWDNAPVLWDALMDAGAPLGIVPAGLGARDTLRLEAAMPLYGHELGPDITPIQAGLTRFVKFDKGDFVGRDALLKQSESGGYTRLTGLILKERGIPRAGYPVLKDDTIIGTVTSGGQAPYLEKAIALALVSPQYTEPGTQLTVGIRDRHVPAEAAVLPFYKRTK
jgi:aminomethyltransferase